MPETAHVVSWRTGRLLFVVVFCGSVVLAGAEEGARSPDSEQVTMVGNISYVSGGIGEDSRQRLSAFAAAFNLKLVMALKSGEYVGEAAISIVDDTGRAFLKTASEGPIFMANLPPGAYEVTAMANDRTLRQRVVVVRGRLATLHFRWP